MKDLLANLNLSFGAKYVAEDTASYILYRFDRSSLGGRAVPLERLARFLGLELACEYVTGDCTRLLGTAAFEPQRIILADGSTLDLPVPTAVVERDIVDRGESSLYRFTLALMCAHMIFYTVKYGGAEEDQLSFDLSSLTSTRHLDIELDTAFDAILNEEESAERFALKLAMPKNGFKRNTVELYARLGINRATLDARKHLPAVLTELSHLYDMPEAAVLARLRELNLY